ncbi:hypothetical protein B0H19DRAFT_1385536 [Mycena capillaripes]|nr:hypothetical protein B0H19DRAFT_1385536 [Mycena capillaripes]
MKFLTKLYDPSVSSASVAMICLDILKDAWSPSNPPTVSSASGAICLDILKDTWSPLLTSSPLLCSPEPNDPQDAEVAKHYLYDEQGSFEETARYWTKTSAVPRGGAVLTASTTSGDTGDKGTIAVLERAHVDRFQMLGSSRAKVPSDWQSQLFTDASNLLDERLRNRSRLRPLHTISRPIRRTCCPPTRPSLPISLILAFFLSLRATTVGGVRKKDKGKKRGLPYDSSDNSDVPVAKRGRPQGSSNYNKDNTKQFLKLAAKLLPIGAKGWKALTINFNQWAIENERPERDVKSLETKYRQLLRKKKPTGEGHCPSDVKRAHQIEALINQKADTRELSDSEFDDGGAAGASSDNIVEVMPSASNVRTAVARRAPSPPLRHASSPPPRRPRMNALELVNQLSKAFDPTVAKARENERAERSFQTTHMLTLSQQLRNSQNSIENLRNQLTAMQTRVHDAERGRKLAELKLQFSHVGSGPVFGGDSADLNTSRRRGRAAVYKANPDLIRHDGQVRCERLYADGGACTQFYSDHSSDDEEEKENRNPSSSSHSRHSSLHQDNSFSLHDDDTLIDYSNLSSTSSHVAEAPRALTATVDGASNNGVDNM